MEPSALIPPCVDLKHYKHKPGPVGWVSSPKIRPVLLPVAKPLPQHGLLTSLPRPLALDNAIKDLSLRFKKAKSTLQREA
jgi:hypothetical protein